jgi:hypothetical protein
VTYVPTIAMGPVNVILRGKPFYEPLPTGDPAERPKRADAPNILKPGEGTGEKRVLSMQEMTEISEQALILCDVAENVVDAEPPDPVKSWLDGIARQGAVHEAVVGPAKKAAAAAGTPAAFKDLAAAMKELLKQDFDCEELEEILAKKPAG